MFFIRPMLRRMLHALPFECAICQRWPCASFEGVSGVCQTCIEQHAHAPTFAVPQGLDACFAAVPFAAPWAALISRYKFAPEPGLARLFASLLLRSAHLRERLAQADTLIPLPLWPERLRQRGFNQALAVARHLVAENKIDSRSLIRTRNTAPQRLMDRQTRQHNVANAFALASAASPLRATSQRSTAYAAATTPSFAGKHVLLIDDVMTTGATLAAAAAPLRRAGASRISAAVIAWTPASNTHPLDPS